MASLRWSLLVLVGVSVVTLTASVTVAPLTTNDVWIHLKTAQLTLAAHGPPHTDSYSFVANGHEYLAHEWLSGLVFYLAYVAGGVNGVIAVKFGVALLTGALLGLASWRRHDRLAVCLLVFGLMSDIAGSRYFERPHIFSFVFIALYLYLFYGLRAAAGRRVSPPRDDLLTETPTYCHPERREGSRQIRGATKAHEILRSAQNDIDRFAPANNAQENSPTVPDASGGVPAPRSSRALPWLLAFLPAQVLWVNMHGGFVQGLALLAVFAAGESVGWVRARLFGLRRDTALPGGVLLWLLCLPVLAVAVSVLNPYGVRLLRYPFELTGMEIYMQEVWEWRRLFDPSYNTMYPFYGYWVWVTVLIGSFFCLPGDAGLRRAWRAAQRVLGVLLVAAVVLFAYGFMWWEPMLEAWKWWWVAAAVLSCAVNIDRIDFADAGVVALMLGLSLQHHRSVGEAVIATFPILSHNLSVVVDRLAVRRAPLAVRIEASSTSSAGMTNRVDPRVPVQSRIGRSHPLAVAAVTVLLLANGILLFVYGYAMGPGFVQARGLGVGGSNPVCAVDYVMRRGITGNAYTSYSEAALLIFRGYPQIKVSMDSRNEVYGPELYAEYLRTKSVPGAMLAFLQKYPVDFILVRDTYMSPAVGDALLRSGQWVQVYFDQWDVVFVRNEAKFAPIIEQDGYQALLPVSSQANPAVDADNAELILREARHAVEACPAAWNAWFYEAAALAQLGRTAEAVAAARQMVTLRPYTWSAWEMVGRLFETLGEPSDARDAYQRALQMNPRAPTAAQRLRALGPES